MLRSMSMRRLWLLFAATLVVGAGVFWFTRTSDDDQIRAQLTRFASVMHKARDSNVMLRAADLRSEFAAIFDESPHVNIPDLTAPLPDARRGLADSAAELTSSVQTLDLDFTDIEIKLDDARASAQVNATATLTMSTAGANEGTSRQARPVTFLLWKRDGTWRISAVNVWAEDERER